MPVINDIREALAHTNDEAILYYGRSFDSALKSIEEDTSGLFVYVDPITYSVDVLNDTETASISIGFLKQDSPDSEHDETFNDSSLQSVENIIEEKKGEFISFITYFNENYNYSIATVNITPVYKVKNVCSGVLATFTLNYKLPC